VLAPYEEHKHRIALDDTMLECMKSLKHCAGVGLLWWLPKLARKWVSQADKIICVSRRQAKIVADQTPELRDKIEIVYNPLPPEIINTMPRKEVDDTPTFLYVGGDSYIKGFHMLLKAIKELGKQGIKARFILTNKYSRESMKILNTLSNKYKNLRIDVVGRLEYHELVKLHEKVWALVFPSIWEEPLPYAVVEAMTLDTIPIASKVGGVPELLDDTMLESFMFALQNSSELIEVIKKLSTFSPDEMLSLSRKLRGIALKKFDVNNISRKIVQIFSSY
jgi:glycosyltransferase involved in cell wall biosynthesis